MSLSLLSATASATEPETRIEISNSTVEAVFADDGIQPCAWSGPAAQVTKIEAIECDWIPDNSGCIYIKLKVTGIGHGSLCDICRFTAPLQKHRN